MTTPYRVGASPATPLEARWRSVIVACLTTMAMEAALVLFLRLL